MNLNINNSIRLIGNVGTDVQLLTFESGVSKAAFRLATNESFKNTTGEWSESVTWHNIISWGKNAERLAKSVQKGARLIVEGTIQYRAYTDKDGNAQLATEVLLSKHEILMPLNTKNSDLSSKEAVSATPF